MATRAILDQSGTVVNVIALEHGADFTPPDGQTLAPAWDAGNLGDTWDGNAFVAPAPAEPPAPADPAPTLDDLIAQLSALQDALVAKQVISQADVDAKATELSRVNGSLSVMGH